MLHFKKSSSKINSLLEKALRNYNIEGCSLDVIQRLSGNKRQKLFVIENFKCWRAVVKTMPRRQSYSLEKIKNILLHPTYESNDNCYDDKTLITDNLK